MADERVVYLHEIRCPSCGDSHAGYVQILPEGLGGAVCDKCGAVITVPLPKDFVVQLPPKDFTYPTHPHVHVTHYPGLYMQPKHAPKLDFADLVRIAYAPTKAFTNLYLTTNLQRALAIVVVFSFLSAIVSILVTADMGEVLGYSTGDALTMAHEGFVGWAVSLLAFLVLSVAAAAIAKGFFGGRGERSATITLIGYTYPAYALLSIVLLFIFTTGFQDLDLTDVQGWSDAELDQAIAAGVVLILVAFVGLAWLLWMVSKAISVANDVSSGEGVLTAILSGIVAGVVYVLAGMVLRLPMGLFL
ncbi:MAG: YIP1 family protein [Candidatus Thermoplasmatota archaeon]|nr:YIP1 family protein [Candidatus Thermoplasmatota archaeon]